MKKHKFLELTKDLKDSCIIRMSEMTWRAVVGVPTNSHPCFFHEDAFVSHDQMDAVSVYAGSNPEMTLGSFRSILDTYPGDRDIHHREIIHAHKPNSEKPVIKKAIQLEQLILLCDYLIIVEEYEMN